MLTLTPTLQLLREAARAASSRIASSAVTLSVAGALTAAILLTAGRGAAAEAEVLASLDDAGSRLLTVEDARPSPAIDPDALDRIRGLEGVEEVVAVGPAFDVRNPALGASAQPVAARYLQGGLPERFTTTTGRAAQPGEALVGPAAQLALGMSAPVGPVESDEGVLFVTGSVTANDHLAFLDSGVLVLPSEPVAVQRVLVLAVDIAYVAPIAEALPAIVALDQPDALTVESPLVLAEVERAVQGRLGQYGRDTIALALAVGVVVSASTNFGLVALRRRDLGRRRALGASRSAVFFLVSAQVGLPAFAGVLLGAAGAVVGLRLQGEPLPPIAFMTGTATLVLVTTLLSAAPAGATAALQDPVRALRVP